MESAADSPLRGLLTRARSQASIAHTFPARLDRVLFGLLYNKVSGAGVPRVIMARAVRAGPRLTIIPGACDSRIQCAVVILGVTHPAAADSKAFAVKLSAKQLAVHIDCASARQNAESRQFAKESAAEKLENDISIQHCEAYAHNYIDQDNPQMVVVLPDPNASGD